MATLTDRVNAFVGDVAMKSPVRVHANTNIVLSDLQTIDGVAVVAGDRVSVGGQTSSINNGIYDVSASAWTRSVDCDGAKDIVGGSLFYIVEGSSFTGVLAAFGGTGAKTPGTDALTITTNITITAASLAGTINAATNKATPVDADLFGIRDSVSGLLNRLTWANLKTALSLVTGNWAINAATATTATNQSGGTVNATTIAASGLISANGGQIKFPAAQVASTDVNTLDDYEEGTWTPSVGGTATYTTQVGFSTKIGRVVHLTFRITINAIGTGSTTDLTGMLYLHGGSPFIGSIGACNILGAATSNVSSNIQFISDTTIRVNVKAAAAVSDGGSAAFASSTTVTGSISYIV